MVVRRTLEQMRRKGEASGGVGVKQTDKVTPAVYPSTIV